MKDLNIKDFLVRMELLYNLLDKKFNKKIAMSDEKIGYFATVNFVEKEYSKLIKYKKKSELYKKLIAFI